MHTYIDQIDHQLIIMHAVRSLEIAREIMHVPYIIRSVQYKCNHAILYDRVIPVRSIDHTRIMLL
jgi:hypothetical protein